MIRNQDRSGWFGASDTAMVMGNWTTQTFRSWWLVKLGTISEHFSTRAMEMGNLFEIPIIHAIEALEGRRIKLGKHPIYLPRYRIRTNYDGLCSTLIEIKTTKKMFKKVPKGYWQQCQVLMFAARRKLTELYAYELNDFDYEAPYFPEIDPGRLHRFEIAYDDAFIHSDYLPRVEILARALRERRYPIAPD